MQSLLVNYKKQKKHFGPKKTQNISLIKERNIKKNVRPTFVQLIRFPVNKKVVTTQMNFC